MLTSKCTTGRSVITLKYVGSVSARPLTRVFVAIWCVKREETPNVGNANCQRPAEGTKNSLRMRLHFGQGLEDSRCVLALQVMEAVATLLELL